MKDAGNSIQMYQERIERLEKALDLCREQRDRRIAFRFTPDEDYERLKDSDEALIMEILNGDREYNEN